MLLIRITLTTDQCLYYNNKVICNDQCDLLLTQLRYENIITNFISILINFLFDFREEPIMIIILILHLTAEKSSQNNKYLPRSFTTLQINHTS